SSWDTIVKSNILALDLEWDIKGNIHTVGIANEKLAGAFQLNEVLEKLKTLLESPHNTIIGHSISGDIAKLIKLGIQPKCAFIDTIILSREFGVSETTQDDGLDYFAENYLMMERYWKDIKYPDDFQEYNSKLAYYCASDAYASILLYKRFQEDFKAEWKQMKTAREIDMAMILPVASMELMGIKLDINVYNKHKEKLQQALEKKRQEITTLYGINPGSPQQVLQALREEGYEIATTNAETLTTLNHALAKAVLDYRELHTLVTRYLTEIQVDENHLIHPKYMISKANTGRGATVNPNLQNIPKDLRDMLVSKFDKDGQLVTIDANQSEYRCMAYLSGYKPLIEAYMQGIDMHTWTSELCKIPRKQAKNLNFARLYGASRTRLETMLVKDGLDTKDAKEIVSDYLELTKGLEEYQRRVVDEAMKRGYVESPYGRRGYRLNYTQVINFPVQSFSSDLNKIRLIKLFNLMKSMLSHIWLEFHDGIEIDLWLPEKERLLELVEELPKTIPDVCKKGINLPLPLEIKFHTKGWLDKG
ncbi:MAG: DNA polymerase, partial [Nitrososphaerota archaeon]